VEPHDDDDVDEDDTGMAIEDCELLEIDHMGPDAPVVGDQWGLWLRCDGATLSGATVIQPTPWDMATVIGNELTFLYAVEGEIKMQSGGYVAYEPVTVTDE
jgi:hypothetical protein